MTTKNLKAGSRFWSEVIVLPNGKFKVKLAKRHAPVKNNPKWVRIDSREFARLLNRSSLLIK